MADYDDGYDDDFYFDDDYFYVEDSYAMADELAENAIPDPPQLELLDDDYYPDYDTYDYWMDIEYGTDEYYDLAPSRSRSTAENTTGSKRKRDSADGTSRGKRQKLGEQNHNGRFGNSGESLSIPRVLWMPTIEVFGLDDHLQTSGSTGVYALVPDWKERFKDAPGFDTQSTFADTADMTMADRAADIASRPDVDDKVEEDEDEDEDDTEDDDDQSDDGDGGIGIDAEALMSALNSKLSGMGLGEAQQDAFMQSIMQMLSKGGGAELDDVLGELTTSLLNQATEGGEDSGLNRWLSQQGVSLEAEGNDAQSEVGEEQPKPRNGQRSRSSPKDSSVNVQQPHLVDNQGGTDSGLLQAASTKRKKASLTAVEDISGASVEAETTKSAVPNKVTSKTSASSSGESPGRPVQVRKRKASAGEAQASSEAPKRRLRSFAAPTASSQGRVAEPVKKTTRSSRQRK